MTRLLFSNQFESSARVPNFELNIFIWFVNFFQVHHDMTADELRRVFHVESHDQGELKLIHSINF